MHHITCVCIYTYICKRVSARTCAYMHTYVYSLSEPTHVHACVPIHTYSTIYVYLCIYIYRYTAHVSTKIYTHICIYIYIHIISIYREREREKQREREREYVVNIGASAKELSHEPFSKNSEPCLSLRRQLQAPRRNLVVRPASSTLARDASAI